MRKLIEAITKPITRRVLNGLAPVVTVAVDNAVRRYSKDNARCEAAAVVAIAADAFCEMMSCKQSEVLRPGVVRYAFDMGDVARFRKLQQAVDEYKESVRNAGN